MDRANIIVIGVGPHARRIYIPIINKLSENNPVKLIGIVDLISQKNLINNYLNEKKITIEKLFFEQFNLDNELPLEYEKQLDSLIKKFNINGVIIATEPLVHKVYAKWALKNGLNILMDKPISVRKSISTDKKEAKLLIDDYKELIKLYNNQQRKKQTIFTINVQRRYEYGFNKVQKLISEVRNKFNVPINSIQAMHADGTWMFPNEVLTQKSHSHFDGYGKIAHSGYHIFDMIWQLYQSSMIKEKHPDTIEILSSPLFPTGLNININENDYNNYFSNKYEKTGLTNHEYIRKIKNYGEIDSLNILRLLKSGVNICNISINLLHSSFSRRAWAKPNVDRYKSNGRVKHQQFIIQQGPFQCIQIHNYQSKSSHDVDNSDEFSIGGNNHFDIYVFRNSEMFSEDTLPLEIISAKDLEIEKNSSHLVNETAKERVILEFINFIVYKTPKEKLKSNIDSHLMPVKIMSGIYQSSCDLVNNSNPLIKINI